MGPLKKSNVCELYGIDFYLNDDLKLWFYKADPSPVLTGLTKSEN